MILQEKELSTPSAFMGGIASIFTFQDEHINENGFKINTNNNSDTPNSKCNNDNSNMDIVADTRTVQYAFMNT